ncbi:MAG: glycosyltransferase family 39 protein [Ktedonobacteraceae bacterium]|nr:glycosyltransferase family 39 protein [Ktedonobacteraceae bacterium]
MHRKRRLLRIVSKSLQGAFACVVWRLQKVVTTRVGRVAPGARQESSLNWQTALTYVVAVALVIIALQMRLHDLGLPFDRDGYDEGVYWQSLRAMAAGHTLYQQIFYSQPPFFLLSIFPTYMLAGQTLWAARLGIALVSLLGLLGAFLLGRALAGHIGAIVALALLVTDPFYLSQSQIIQAEISCTALSLLAVGLAYLWWEHPEGVAGLCYAVFAGVALSLSILSKLLEVATLVPLGLLFLAHLWRILRQPRETRLHSARSLIAGLSAFLVVSAAFILPFSGSLHQMVQGVITFHTDAAKQFKETISQNFPSMLHLLTSITAFAALLGIIIALARRDWRVLPLIAWLLATLYLLLEQAPLFHHHLVVLIAPLLSLAVMGIGPIIRSKKVSAILVDSATATAVCVLLFVAVQNWQGDQRYFSGQLQQAVSSVHLDGQVVQDLQANTTRGQLVVTDAQFLVGLADRSTPASLVDTSMVRIVTGYVTLPQLISEASQPDVYAVLFYTGRLNRQGISGFHIWVTHHFRLVKRYLSGGELWSRV